MTTKTAKSILLIAMCGLLAGCDVGMREASSPQNNPSLSHSEAHPKLSFHKPKNFVSAVGRLREIHESLVADGEFPEPVSFQYVEVIHGEGPSGHSHFYTAESYDANHDSHHDQYPGENHEHEEDETVKYHSTTVNVRTELTDVVAWLPEIAAESDFNEADWNSVKTISEQLKEFLEAIDSSSPDASFRDAWKLKSEDIRALLGELEMLSASLGAVK